MGMRNKVIRIAAAFMCAVLVTAAAVPAVQAGAAAESKEESKEADGGILDRIREKLPDIEFAEFDADAEKEKLREAIRTMDELGVSPEMLVKNAWEFLNRKENKEKIDQAVEDIRDTVEDVTGEK